MAQMNWGKVGSGIGKIGGTIEKAGETYGGESSSTNTGTGRKVGSMARRAVGKLRSRRKGNGNGTGTKPTFKYSGKTMSA